jgi:alpha-D-ribose 1-methylphosphonate 5-triphosphate diphosphatase PhnM
VPNEESERRAAVEQMARTVGLDIASHLDGVAANFARIEALASVVMAFPLPAHADIGVIFVP